MRLKEIVLEILKHIFTYKEYATYDDVLIEYFTGLRERHYKEKYKAESITRMVRKLSEEGYIYGDGRGRFYKLKL